MHRILCVLLCLAEAVVAAGEPSFTTTPNAVTEGGKTAIRFAVSAPTDVAVAVLDAKGQMVRHLAAGLLGANAPEPLKEDSLAQEIAWDGTDDLGKPAAGGPFRVAVSLGVKPRLDKIVGWDGNTLGSAVVGLTVGPKGEVFVLTSEGSRGRSTMRVMDREGKYLRTIIPYPPNLPKERTAPLGQLEVEGERLPIVFNGHGGNLLPLTSGMKKQNMVFSPKGHLIMASAVGTIVEHGPPRYLLALAPDGGAVEGVPFVGPQIRQAVGFMGGSGEGGSRFFDHLALSPDGTWVYLTMSGESWRFKPRHAVFRLKWADAELAAPFLGHDEPGADDAHFNDPQGLAADKAGNLFVCDRGNGRVMAFSPGGKLLGKFPVENPEQVVVHPRSGEIYVACRKAGRMVTDCKLVKLSPLAANPPRELATLEISNLDVIALDPQADPPRLWAYCGALRTGTNRDRYGRSDLRPIEDRGDKLELGEPVSNANGLGYPMFFAVDPGGNRLLIDDSFASSLPLLSLDLATGKKTPFVRGTAVALDRDRNVYVTDGYDTNTISRYDPAGKPLPFASVNSHKLPVGKYRAYGPDLGLRGLCVGLNGDIYLLRSHNYGLEDNAAARLDVYGPDGARKRTLVDGLGHGDCGLGVDPRGNVYLGCNVKPQDQPFPPEFAGKLPQEPWVWWRKQREAPWCYPYYNAYLYHWGALLKFGPEGGTLYGHAPNGSKEPPPEALRLASAPPDAVSLRSGYLAREIKVKGALWRRPGYGIVPSSDVNWGDPACMCMVSHLAVDGYGRVFAPNCFRFTVEMLDTNGNLLGRIGRYGNADSAGPGSAVPEPEIAFAWPAFVAHADGKVYVSDSTSQRVTVGFPFGAKPGLEPTVTTGTISALRREAETGALHRVQLDANVNPGNSGGPVVDERGNVVAVMVAIVKPTVGSGMALGIPCGAAEAFLKVARQAKRRTAQLQVTGKLPVRNVHIGKGQKAEEIWGTSVSFTLRSTRGTDELPTVTLEVSNRRREVVARESVEVGALEPREERSLTVRLRRVAFDDVASCRIVE